MRVEWEKPEREASEDFCAVRSSKAKRLSHVKPGYYNPPSRPIIVPGLHWLAVVVVGRVASLGPPRLAAMRWWSSRGVQASFRRDEEGKLLVSLLPWGRMVVHVFDQGFAGAFWLGLLLAFDLRFVLRWRKDYQLLDAQGNRRKTWRIAMGKRGWSERTVWDSRRAESGQSECTGTPGAPCRASGVATLAGGLREPRTHSLVSVDPEPHQHRRRGLARGVCLHGPLAN
jgi:hypothetical protein